MPNDKTNPFDDVASEFIHDLDALREMIDPVMIMAYSIREQERKNHIEKLETFGTLKDSDGAYRTFEVPAKHVRAVNKSHKKHARCITSTNLLPRTFLVSFVSVYDSFLGKLIHALFGAKPEVLDSSEKNITFKQLKEYPTIEAAT